MPDLVTTYTSIKAAIEIAKFIKDSGNSLEKAIHESKLSEIICTLSELKIVLADKNNEINELKNQLKLRDTMKFENGVMYRVLDDGNKEGPFCQACYQKDKVISNLHEYDEDGLQCRVCEKFFRFKPKERPRSYNMTSPWNEFGWMGR